MDRHGGQGRLAMTMRLTDGNILQTSGSPERGKTHTPWGNLRPFVNGLFPWTAV
jgi:hypothetical protein